MVSQSFKRLSFKLIIVIISVKVVSSEIYSSLAHIQDELLKRRQDTSISELKRLLDSQEQTLVGIKRIIQTLDDLGSGVRDPDFTVHHPLDAYRFIKNHSVIYGDAVTDLLEEIQLYKSDQEKVDNIINLLTSLPSEDLLGTVHGLLRMQNVYALRTQDIADGNIRNFTTRRMSAAECVDMMALAYTYLKYSHFALEWTNMAIIRVAEGDRTSSVSNILTKGAALAFKMGDENEAVLLYEHLFNLNPKNRYYKYKLKHYKRNAPEKTKVGYVMSHVDTCRGISQKKTKTTDRRLLCRYLDNGHPLLRYQPAKLEVLSLDPYISVYHDCVDKTLATLIKNQARSHLERSKTTDGTIYRKSNIRTSKGVFFEISTLVEKLYRYVEAITSLKWKDSYDLMQGCIARADCVKEYSHEPVRASGNASLYSQRERYNPSEHHSHVSNYGIGGHYNNHHDFYYENQQGVEMKNDRLATFLIYLSDVEEGGATGFPLIGEAVRPKAGNALFWYNLYPNGRGNKETLHTSCPVIVGDKWIVTLLIHRNGQEFTRPCNLQENDTRWKL